MKEMCLPPKASSLAESMRDLGYSLEAAIADIIDNSIAASATRIDICFNLDAENVSFAILDDGKGMTKSELIEAMRHGARSPKEDRTSGDLGRFGLGLKTASFSQCKKLTVISIVGGRRAGAVWDLGVITNRDDWIISLLEEDEIRNTPYTDKLEKNGTLVLWEDLDRLCEGNINSIKKDAIYGRLDDVEKHLSLVFHRYLTGEFQGRRISIFINEHEVKAFDPFCVKNKATQALREEIIRIDGLEVKIQPYILPHHSRLSQKESDYYKSRSDFLNNQGAYIYRSGRLMTWGDWLKLVPKGEATKLARVKIDFPTSLDNRWTIDVKKSRAYPPFEVRERLRQIIGRITEQSTRVHTGRGKKLFEENPRPVWQRYAENEGIRYALNREHPLFEVLKKILGDGEKRGFDEMMTVIEASLPVEAIYSDYAMHPKELEKGPIVDWEDAHSKLEAVWSILMQGEDAREETIRSVLSFLKPYCDYDGLIDEFLKGKYNG